MFIQDYFYDFQQRLVLLFKQKGGGGGEDAE